MTKAFSPVQIDRALVAEAPTPMYRWHRFWTRKPHNVVATYVEHYSEPGDLVLDPFSGSGVAIIEAVKRGRRAISIDIIPSAIDIQRATLQPADLEVLDRAFGQVERAVRGRIEKLYLTRCRKCGSDIQPTCLIWIQEEPKEIRYHCPYCSDLQQSGCRLTEADHGLLRELEDGSAAEWYPTNRLCYPNGSPFMKGEGHATVDTLFTPRNLRALAALFSAIGNVPDSRAAWFLKMAFSSMVHLAAKLAPARDARPFASFWAQHSFWVPPEGYMEMNVWHLFDSAYRGRQGLRKAKAESNKQLGSPKDATSLAHLAKGSGDYLLLCEPALLALKKLPADSVDYVFTDPPYGGSIQFGELSYLWVSWLHPELSEESYLQYLADHEVTINDNQGKDFDLYYNLLYATFQEVYRVLKPGRYMTVTFHNPKTRIRNATIRAAMFSGFDYQKIIYQPPAITSYKSLLQPFGSADGDFFFRFRKPPGRAAVAMEEADKATFERIVVETAKRVLAERGEPTPYTHLINYVDPVLAQHGYFLSLNPEIDVDDVLRKHSGPGKEFRRVEQTIHNVTGQSWWFQDIDVVYRLAQIPLVERVEATILRLLRRKHTVSFTEALTAVFTEFPNSLTPDSANVMEVLEEYAEHTGSGLWRVKRTLEDEQSAHSEMIYLLARMGRRAGYDVWVGRREQAQSWMMTRLEKLNTRAELGLHGLGDGQFERAEMIDVIWYKEGAAVSAFEVENTTMLTEALLRCSVLPTPAKRFMVVPMSRNRFVHRKMGSPLFREMVERDGWMFLYYEEVRQLAHERSVSLADLQAKGALAAVTPERPRAGRRPRAAAAPQMRFDNL